MFRDSSTNNIWRGRILRYAPLLLWIGVIFFLSSGHASLAETSRFIGPILKFLFPAATPETLLAYHGYIRKFAHFAEYAVLAFFVSRALYSSSVRILRSFWFAASILFVVIVALIDEGSQAMSSARTGSIRDVFIDGLGGAAIIVFLLLFNYRWPLNRVFTRAAREGQ